MGLMAGPDIGRQICETVTLSSTFRFMGGFDDRFVRFFENVSFYTKIPVVF